MSQMASGSEQTSRLRPDRCTHTHTHTIIESPCLGNCMHSDSIGRVGAALQLIIVRR
eukprot:COSAG01_NODE_5548_length_4191_cov_36.852151_1_plen_57_part_00